jgi:hypothetical protein
VDGGVAMSDLQRAFNELHREYKQLVSLFNFTRLIMDQTSRDEAGDIVTKAIELANRTEKFLK